VAHHSWQAGNLSYLLDRRTDDASYRERRARWLRLCLSFNARAIRATL
jgi:5'-deoxynucleotidase YfbR-like HD superfamily hydrolase